MSTAVSWPLGKEKTGLHWVELPGTEFWSLGLGRGDVKSVADAELAFFCPPVRPGFAFKSFALEPVPELGSLNGSDCQSIWLPLGWRSKLGRRGLLPRGHVAMSKDSFGCYN